MAAKKTFDHIGARDVRIERIETHEVKELADSLCPCCGAGPMDGVTGMQIKTLDPPGGPWDVVDFDEQDFSPIYPSEGTPTVCAYCGELCIFRSQGDKLRIDIPTAAEVDKWRVEPGIWRVLDKAQQYFKEKALQARLSGDMRYAKFKPRRF